MSRIIECHSIKKELSKIIEKRTEIVTTLYFLNNGNNKLLFKSVMVTSYFYKVSLPTLDKDQEFATN